MLQERRRAQRHVINRVGKFRTDPKALPRECLITDISDLGARLFVDGVEVPDQFELLITGLQAMRRQCSVKWRLGGEVGVAFVADSAHDDSAGQGR